MLSSSGFPTGTTGHVSLRVLPTGNEVMVSWAFVTVNTKFAYNNNKIIPGNNSGGGVGASWWYGQGVYSLSLG